MGLLAFPALGSLPGVQPDIQPIGSVQAQQLLKAARSQIGVTTSYDPAYVRLDYPGGDVPEDRGVCIDVVIRAYRQAFDFDFQKAIHEDMAASFTSYPAIWGLKRPDRNIDHRRVPNLAHYLARTDCELPRSADWQAGDLISCHLPGNLPHLAIISRNANHDTLILKVIHNIGRGTREENFLLTGLSHIQHFRFHPAIVELL